MSNVLASLLIDKILEVSLLLQNALATRNFQTERVDNSIIVKRNDFVYILDIRLEAVINSNGLVLKESIDILWRNTKTSERGFKQINNDLNELLVFI